MAKIGARKIGAQKIGAQARMVLAALEDGRQFRRMGDAWRAGTMIATAAAIGELARHDLARIDEDRLTLTAAGQGYGARSATPAAANRLLVERGFAEPGAAAAKTRRVTMNLAESPLGWLKARGLLGDRQMRAGERLRGDWTAASLAPSVTMRWDASPVARGARGPGRPMDATMAQIAAKRRFEAAVTAVGGGLGDILWRVVCAGEGLETAEKALGWPKRAGKLVLLMALDRLADHYAI